MGFHEQGKKQGQGVYVWEDGSSFDGLFANDEMVESQGVFHNPNGGTSSGGEREDGHGHHEQEHDALHHDEVYEVENY